MNAVPIASSSAANPTVITDRGAARHVDRHGGGDRAITRRRPTSAPAAPARAAASPCCRRRRSAFRSRSRAPAPQRHGAADDASGDAAGDGEPVRRHGRAARDAAGGLVPAAKTVDNLAPSSSDSDPGGGRAAAAGRRRHHQRDGGRRGRDGRGCRSRRWISGAYWHAANGRGAWNYVWTPSTLGSYTIKSRAVERQRQRRSAGTGDDGERRDSASRSLLSSAPSGTIRRRRPSPTPPIRTRWKSARGSSRRWLDYITAIRFTKAISTPASTSATCGTTSSAVRRIASVTFANESASGWQEAKLDQPVQIAGQHDLRRLAFRAGRATTRSPAPTSPRRRFDHPPLKALQDSAGRFDQRVVHLTTSATSRTARSTPANYWVDVEVRRRRWNWPAEREQRQLHDQRRHDADRERAGRAVQRQRQAGRQSDDRGARLGHGARHR